MIKTINGQSFKNFIGDDSVVLVDVRTADEFATGSVEGAINIPVDEIESRLNELDKSKPHIMICVVGNRSNKACEILDANGFDVTNLEGGIVGLN